MTGFGIITWAEPNEPIRNMGEVAKSVENHGFDSLWIWDTPLYTKDAYTALTVAALSTDKIRLGPGVSNLVTRDLCVTANAISALDEFVKDIERLKSHFCYRISPSGFGSEVLDIVPDRLLKHLAIAGTETECLERLKEIIALAPDEITFRLLSNERECV